MDYTFDQSTREILLSERLRDAMLKVAVDRSLSERQILWMIDNFYLHEIFHFAQGMGGGLHSGLRSEAPQVLLAIDYQADAIAALTSTILTWYAPEQFGYEAPTYADNHWTLYATGIEAVLHQMEVFTCLTRKDMDRKATASMLVTLDRLQRIATWHHQTHRCALFEPQLPLADFQILSQPILDFRNVALAALLNPDAITREWPQNEVAVVDKAVGAKAVPKDASRESLLARDMLIATGVTPDGTTRFERHSPRPAQYVDAFKGFFELDTGLSREFFTTLFVTHDWMIGKTAARSGTRKRGKKKEGRDLSVETQALAKDLESDRRIGLLEELLTPARSALVVAGV